MTSPTRISVVIPARNASRTLHAQLAAVSRSCGPACEIIVVDNASTDDTAAVAAGFPGVQVVSCARAGANAARNRGVLASSGEKILLCDADDVVSASWCHAMTVALDTDDIVGGALDWETLNVPFVRTTQKHELEHGLYQWLGSGYPIGANMAFRRAVFDSIGGFDEAFPVQFDEIDFCYRAADRGYTIGFAPDTLVAYRARSDARSAARRAAAYTLAAAQFRAKHGVHQPWQSKVLRSANHVRKVVGILKCRTRAGRWEYLQDLASAGAALRGFLRYGFVG